MRKSDTIISLEDEINQQFDPKKFPGWDFQKINEVFRVSEEIIQTLTPEAILELTNSTYGKDLNKVFDTVLEESYNVVYGKQPKGSLTSDTFGYMDKLTTSVEETLRCENLIYFITSVLPHFELAPHHLEWCEIYQLYKRAAVIAARDHGKSFCYSNAIPAWICYKYKGDKGRTPAERNPRMFIFSFSIQQSIDLLEILQNTIEDTDILRERLFDKNKFSKTEIRCLNKKRVTVKGFGSSVRGAHPGEIIIDDPLKDNVLFSKPQREKSTSYLHSVIMNMIVPGGSVHIVGCVEGDSWIVTNRGLEQINKMSPVTDLKERKLLSYNKSIYGLNNEYNKAVKYWSNGLTDTIKIKTFADYELECSQVHPIMTLKEGGIMGWCKASELKIDDFILIKGKIENIGTPIKIKGKFDFERTWRHRNKLFLPEYANKDMGYLLGLLISEGSLDKNGKGGFGISASEKEITDFLSSKPFGLNFRLKPANNSWAVCSNEFGAFLNWIGTKFVNAPEKEVPYRIMQADKEVVTGFLQGMFDGDGGCDKKTGSPGVASTSYKLIQQIKLLLLHYYGIRSSVKCSKPGISPRAKGKYYCHSLSILRAESIRKFYTEIGFRLKRKDVGRDYNHINRESEDYIPHVKKYILALNKIDNKHGECFYKVRDGFTFTVTLIKKVLNYYKGICPDNENYIKLKEIFDFYLKGYNWERVTKLSTGKTYTYDFVVPKTNSFISNGIVSHNTPFHSNDLYGDLKTKKGWHVFEYPGIYPDGHLLWANRWNFEGLMEKKDTQGNLIFSREILCRPISSDSTIFPISILNNALFNMEEFMLVQNRESYKKKFDTVVIGCDFAISGSVGADYTVFTTWGVDDLDRMWLMNVYRAKGASYAEQLAMLKRLNVEFRPDLIMLEQNAFQQIFVQESERAGLPVMGHTTTGRKSNLQEGLPSLAILFERGKFKVPMGDQRSKDFADEMVLEFSSVAFTDEHGLQGTGQHDDITLSFWIAVECARQLTTGGLAFNFDFI